MMTFEDIFYDVLSTHIPIDDMFNNIECMGCDWETWENIHDPKADDEFRHHLAKVLAERVENA